MRQRQEFPEFSLFTLFVFFIWFLDTAKILCTEWTCTTGDETNCHATVTTAEFTSEAAVLSWSISRLVEVYTSPFPKGACLGAAGGVGGAVGVGYPVIAYGGTVYILPSVGHTLKDGWDLLQDGYKDKQERLEDLDKIAELQVYTSYLLELKRLLYTLCPFPCSFGELPFSLFTVQIMNNYILLYFIIFPPRR